MKILVDGAIFDSYPYGGIARFYREVLPRVADQNPEWIIYVTSEVKSLNQLPCHDRIIPKSFQKLNFRPTRISSRINAALINRFQKKIAALDVDVFHSTYYTLPKFFTAKSVNVLYDLIDLEYPLIMPNGPDFVERQKEALLNSDHVVAISRASMLAAKEKYGLDSKKISWTHLDASDVFEPESESKKENFREEHTNHKPFFLYVGSTNSYKNLGVLIRAFALIQAKTEHVLLLAGHSMGRLERCYEELAIELGVEKRIMRLIHPDDTLLGQAYAAAEAFVFPSLQEGFGIPLVEAMRCGTPVIASDIDVFREVCGDAALYFDPHDPVQLSLLMGEVEEIDRAQGLAQKGIERAKSFSWDRTAETLANIYNKITRASADSGSALG